MISLYLSNSMTLSLTGLADDTGAAVTTATVEATVFDTDATTELPGVAWPLSMPYASGAYSAQLPANLQVVEGDIYFVAIKATAGSAVFSEELWVRAEKRVAQ